MKAMSRTRGLAEPASSEDLETEPGLITGECTTHCTMALKSMRWWWGLPRNGCPGTGHTIGPGRLYEQMIAGAASLAIVQPFMDNGVHRNSVEENSSADSDEEICRTRKNVDDGYFWKHP